MVKDGGRRRMICQWAVRVNSWCVVVGLMGVDWRVISGGHQWSVGNNWGLMVGQGRLLDERGRVNLMRGWVNLCWDERLWGNQFCGLCWDVLGGGSIDRRWEVLGWSGSDELCGCWGKHSCSDSIACRFRDDSVETINSISSLSEEWQLTQFETKCAQQTHVIDSSSGSVRLEQRVLQANKREIPIRRLNLQVGGRQVHK